MKAQNGGSVMKAQSGCRCSTWKPRRQGGYEMLCHGPDGRVCAVASYEGYGQNLYHIWVSAESPTGKQSGDESGYRSFDRPSEVRAEAERMLARAKADVGFAGLHRTLGCGCGRR